MGSCIGKQPVQQEFSVNCFCFQKNYYAPEVSPAKTTSLTQKPERSQSSASSHLTYEPSISCQKTIDVNYIKIETEL